MQAADIMTRKVITLSPDHSVKHDACPMLENHISGLPVRDDNGNLVGIISEGDLLRRAELGPGAWRGIGSRRGEDAENHIKGHSWRVGDVMTSGVVTVAEDTSVDGIAAIMMAHEIKRVPVMGVGAMVGIASRSDILQAIATAIPDVAAAGDQVTRRVVLARLCSGVWLDRGAIDVTVEAGTGTVSLWGEVDSDAKCEAARVAAEAVSGVGRVRNKLRIGTGSSLSERP